MRLKSAAEQRQSLDLYAGEELANLLEKYRENYERYRAAAAELKEVRENSRARALEAQTLQVPSKKSAPSIRRPGKKKSSKPKW